MESVIRFFHPLLNHSYFLFGARGTGKSTWTTTAYPDAALIDLLQPDIYRQYKAYPERLREFVLAQPNQSCFIIDEVQKVPELLTVVHSLIEKKQGWCFVLTGSSARKLKREGVDLLAGRAHFNVMHPFMAAELKQAFNLDDSLQQGLLPLVVFSKNPQADLRAYIALYMKEEVQMEGLVRAYDQFSRFLEAISFSQGSVLNYANIGRDCSVSSKTVENYISILEDLLLSFRVQVFTKKAKRNLSSHAKFYYFDAGVYRSIRPKGPLDYPELITGHALETLVAQHLRAWLSYSQKQGELYFWRTKSGLEVDFIVYGEIGFYALEIKNSRLVKPEDLRGLREFKKDYPESQCIFLYRGEDRLQKGDVLCYPLEKFLLQLTPDQSFI